MKLRGYPLALCSGITLWDSEGHTWAGCMKGKHPTTLCYLSGPTCSSFPAWIITSLQFFCVYRKGSFEFSKLQAKLVRALDSGEHPHCSSFGRVFAALGRTPGSRMAGLKQMDIFKIPGAGCPSPPETVMCFTPSPA